MHEIHHILCPVDFSHASRRAVDLAKGLAGWYGAKITALHVCNPLVIPSAEFTVAGIVPPPVLTDEEILGAREQLAACFGSEPSATLELVVQSGHPAKCIVGLAQSAGADLIVMGTHGFGGIEHLVLGSVTEKVLRRATCPVMTVPPHDHSTATLPFKHLLCPVDFSDSSLAGVDAAVALARRTDAQVTVLHVFDADDEPLTDRPITVPEYRRQLEHELTKKLEALVPDGARAGCQLRARTAHGRAYREILAMAAAEKADLIVMGVRGRNAIDLMLLGSTTNQVVRRATCPVLSLRR